MTKRNPPDLTPRNARSAQQKIAALDKRLKKIEWRVAMIESVTGVDPWRSPKAKRTQ